MKRPIILASQSPRRRDLIQLLDRTVHCTSADLEEKVNAHEKPEAVVMGLAFQKLMAAFQQSEADLKALDGIWIGSDTVVTLDGVIYGKPEDEADAYRMLSNLSGKTHQVLTGVALYVPTQNTKLVFYETTDVTFRTLSNELIQWYLNTGDHRDKAGAYGIQNQGARLVRKIQGDFFNVVGLPVASIDEMLSQLSL